MDYFRLANIFAINISTFCSVTDDVCEIVQCVNEDVSFNNVFNAVIKVITVFFHCRHNYTYISCTSVDELKFVNVVAFSADFKYGILRSVEGRDW